MTFQSNLAGRVNIVLDNAIAEKRLVGAVALVAKDGELVYRRAAGLADREAGRAMREGDVFRLASVTKPFVAAAAMRLVEDGAIALDDPVTHFLPDFRPRLPSGEAPTLTIHHLLTHTSRRLAAAPSRRAAGAIRWRWTSSARSSPRRPVERCPISCVRRCSTRSTYATAASSPRRTPRWSPPIATVRLSRPA